SDLASVQTRAVRVDGGWSVTGTKLWSGGAHLNDWFVVLCRTSEEENRHAGLSQLIVDLRAEGVTARPITYMDGTEFFCEVTLSDVFVPDGLVLGEIGAGWAQNTSELAFERAGPERWLSTYLVVEELLRQFDSLPLPEEGADLVGNAAASYWVLHHLTLALARVIDAGEAPTIEA